MVNKLIQSNSSSSSKKKKIKKTKNPLRNQSFNYRSKMVFEPVARSSNIKIEPTNSPSKLDTITVEDPKLSCKSRTMVVPEKVTFSNIDDFLR